MKRLIVCCSVALAILALSFVPSVSAQTTHTVKAGENLSQIAQRYNTSITEITRLNNIYNPNFIVVGQRIILPSSETTSTYYVKSGDTLSDIAVELRTTVSKLIQLNGISNPNFLRIGAPIKYSKNAVTNTADVPSSFKYRVREGDTLSSVAKRFETSVSEIRKLNNLSSNAQIYAKNLITIPSPQIIYTIHYWAVQYGVPPDLLKALTWWESGWDNRLVSYAGAIGIGQLIPNTVSFVSEALIGRRLNPYIPEQNIQMSARFIAYLLAETNYNTNYALASYYQGLGAVRRHGVYNSSWNYINGIQALRAQF